MIFYLSLACKWILRDAIDISGSRSIIGADTMVPLFTMVLIHSRIPNIHLLLYILMQYGEYDEQGDVSYNIANLEGSMSFIMGMEINEDIEEIFQQTPLYESILTSIKGNSALKKKIEGEKAVSSSPSELASSSSPSSGGLLGSGGVYDNGSSKVAASTMSVATLSAMSSTRAEDLKAMEELGKLILFRSVVS
jgi:hypothetical protein